MKLRAAFVELAAQGGKLCHMLVVHRVQIVFSLAQRLSDAQLDQVMMTQTTPLPPHLRDAYLRKRGGCAQAAKRLYFYFHC
jgi:hypothetical protein